MEPTQAFKVVDQATSKLSLDRQGHEVVRQALLVLAKECGLIDNKVELQGEVKDGNISESKAGAKASD